MEQNNQRIQRNFLGANFTRSQIKEHEKELKTSYKLIKELINKSDISWDNSRFQILTSDEVWKGLIQAKSFPLFDSIASLYEGNITEGRRNFTSIRHNNEEKDLYFGDSSSRHMALEDRDFEVFNNQFEVPPPSTQEPSSRKHSRKHSRNNTSQDSFSEIPRKRRKSSGDRMAEAMDGYVEFKKADSNRKLAHRIEFSISKCMEILNDMDELTEDEVMKATNIFHDANNRETFISLSPRFRVTLIRQKVASDI